MMYAELIDQDDFRRLVRDLGVSVSEQDGPEACCRAALQWQQHSGCSSLRALLDALQSERHLLHPEVSQALDRVLVPGLFNR
ncbi:hypothetical protein [Balneatrix alpica]|uniref:Uncharacterized protein n=1 Tax=Balneatrix alpica TaxID=75684 RepID=A0ABV5ZDR1_9GAMM|nr:hypothetical protein [Balneatrix alpica]